ncbi:DUF2474 domain-containing protein [Methylocaldum marinum]|nr:DUF2474 domain-containing protein [Methylocaldum marinum]
MKPADEKPLRQKLAWFFLLWAASVGTAAAVGYAIKLAVGLL